MASSPIRLDDDLMRKAQVEAALHHRSLPKQIEYWASLGRQVAKMVGPEDLLKVQLGLAALHLEAARGQPVAPGAVRGALSRLRESGDLAQQVTRSPVVYEAAPGRPGYLVRIVGDQREIGRFQNGHFIAEPAAGE